MIVMKLASLRRAGVFCTIALVIGKLSNDGVSLQAFQSALRETLDWRADVCRRNQQ
jgi:hypothetical protein